MENQTVEQTLVERSNRYGGGKRIMKQVLIYEYKDGSDRRVLLEREGDDAVVVIDIGLPIGYRFPLSIFTAVTDQFPNNPFRDIDWWKALEELVVMGWEDSDG